MYQFSCWSHLYICYGLGLLDHLIGKYITRFSEVNNVVFLPCLVEISFCQFWGTYHNQQLLLETWHESLVSANTSNTCISCGRLWWGDQYSQCVSKYQDKFDAPRSSQFPNTSYYQTVFVLTLLINLWVYHVYQISCILRVAHLLLTIDLYET